MTGIDRETQIEIARFKAIRIGFEFENLFDDKTWINSNRKVNVGLQVIQDCLDRIEKLIEKNPKEGLNTLWNIGRKFKRDEKGLNDSEIEAEIYPIETNYIDRGEYAKKVKEQLMKQLFEREVKNDPQRVDREEVKRS